MTKTRQQAAARLQEVQAQMFVWGEEAKQLAGYLNGAAQEDREYIYAKQEAERFAEMEAAAEAAPSPNEESAEAENETAESA